MTFPSTAVDEPVVVEVPPVAVPPVIAVPPVVADVGLCARSVTFVPLLSHDSTWDARILVLPVGRIGTEFSN